MSEFGLMEWLFQLDSHTNNYKLNIIIFFNLFKYMYLVICKQDISIERKKLQGTI